MCSHSSVSPPDHCPAPEAERKLSIAWPLQRVPEGEGSALPGGVADLCGAAPERSQKPRVHLAGHPKVRGTGKWLSVEEVPGGRHFPILGGLGSLCLAGALTGRPACSASNMEAFWTVLAEEGGGIRQFILTLFCVWFSSFHVSYFLQ